jgi:hypothetical protein
VWGGRAPAAASFPQGCPGLGDIPDAAVIDDLPVTELEVLVQVDRYCGEPPELPAVSPRDFPMTSWLITLDPFLKFLKFCAPERSQLQQGYVTRIGGGSPNREAI